MVCHITESVVNHTATSRRQVKLSKSMSDHVFKSITVIEDAVGIMRFNIQNLKVNFTTCYLFIA